MTETADTPTPRRRLSGATTTPRNQISTPKFTQPVRQVLLMLLVLGAVGAGVTLALTRILPIFSANVFLNGIILAVFVLGVLACFWQVAQLVTSVSWIERFAARRQNALQAGVAPQDQADPDQAPRLLAPLAALLGARGPTSGVISTGSARSILDSVATRIDEARDITKYLANLLIFLGLLGTFYGLATTVPAVVETIRALAPEDGQTGLEVFDKLMTGLEAQLGGMGTAFSSSLLGLAGSLVVGLLELFVTHGQNRFFRELEEWMSGFTRISLAATDGDGVDSAAVAGFLDQMATQMVTLQNFYAERDELRDQEALEADQRILLLVQGIERMVKHSTAETEATVARAANLTRALNDLAQGQKRLIEVAEAGPSDDPEARMHLRNIDLALGRLAEESASTQAEMLTGLRAELAALRRDLRALATGGEHGA
ncbi:MAG: biopolymer transporter ExbB [Paracoccus sp. (in: a-proteobacteria)]|uniref:biopolymer transporter ExbB n=1 Tax=Paracoccus sp. TaxID=267 RepID=UPI0026DFAB6F|nr:biopolymer transporter ExbB [Paracoccus sp. (in: a-proteobacteria)]MDO5621114.1 biopolymer transporter ExbB [Paracoccus sp. (in: a-proteobacteria)]